MYKLGSGYRSARAACYLRRVEDMEAEIKFSNDVFFFSSYQFRQRALCVDMTMTHHAVLQLNIFFVFRSMYLSNYRWDLAEIFKRCFSWPWEQNAQKNFFLKIFFFQLFSEPTFLLNYGLDLVHTWSNNNFCRVYDSIDDISENFDVELLFY